MVETSPNNYQAGYILKEPIYDRSLAEKLINGVVLKTGGDQGAKNVVRWSRLPFGSNTKASVVRAHGNPFRTRLVLWEPELRYTPEKIAEAYEIDLSEQCAKKTVTSRKSGVIKNVGSGDKLDSLTTWLFDNGYLRTGGAKL